MMRIIMLLMLFVLGFIGMIAGMLAISGNLNGEAIGRLLGRDGEEVAAPMEAPDEIGPIAKRLQQEREALEARAAALDEREEQLNQRERGLDELLNEITSRQEMLASNLDEMDAEREQRLADTAKRMEAMKPDMAAAALSELSPEDAVQIIFQIKERNAGKILDEMDALRRNLIVQVMQERAY